MLLLRTCQTRTPGIFRSPPHAPDRGSRRPLLPTTCKRTLVGKYFQSGTVFEFFISMIEKLDPQSDTSLSRLPLENIPRRILTIRSHRVMLDLDLAELYGVTTKRLNEAVRRNAARFPNDFMFQLAPGESKSLRSQFATSNGRGGRRYLPYAFTEQGVAMLSSVLNSKRAILVNIAIMRAFVRLRETMGAHKEFARTLEDLEQKYTAHDTQIKGIFDALRALMVPPKTPRRRIGF